MFCPVQLKHATFVHHAITPAVTLHHERTNTSGHRTTSTLVLYVDDGFRYAANMNQNNPNHIISHK